MQNGHMFRHLLQFKKVFGMLRYNDLNLLAIDWQLIDSKMELGADTHVKCIGQLFVA